METSDEALVLACRRGEEAAWEALVARYQRLIYTLALHAGLDKDQSDDLFQHVFATLLENLDRIEQPALLRPWLMTTAQREAWRLRRRERVVGVITANDLAQVELPDETLWPEDMLLRLEEQHKVRTALMSLDERCRTLLTLLFYRSNPPSYETIAALLGMTEGGIGPTRARCLRKLRHLLEE